MTSSLAILNESHTLERMDHLPGGQRWKLGHLSNGDSHSDGDPSLKRLSLLWNRFSVGHKAFQIQPDRFLDVALGLLQGFTLRVATRQSRDRGHKASLRGVFVKDRIREFAGSLARHHLHCKGSGSNQQRNVPNRIAPGNSAAIGFESMKGCSD